MNNILSRVLTGFLGGLVGGILNCLNFLFVTYLMRTFSANYVRADDILDYTAFGVVGILFGLVLGLIVGIIQPKPVKGFLIGGSVVFFIEIILLLSDAKQTPIESITIVKVSVALLLLLILIIGGCLTGGAIGVVGNWFKSLSARNQE
jgi:hypothetical protein